MRQTRVRGRYLVLAAVVGALTGLAVGPAAAAPSMNISFQASSGNSAGWDVGHQEAYLSMGATSAADGFAVIYVHHTPNLLPSTEPSYTVDGYASGTPRIFIDMSDGNYAFIYPNGVLAPGDVEYHADGSTGYEPYQAFHTDEGSTAVAAVYIIADTSQNVPYTAYITSFQYNDDYLIGTAPSITFQYFGNSANCSLQDSNTEIQCTLGGSGNAAILNVNYPSTALPIEEPTFSYASNGGPPRWVIGVSDSTGTGTLWQPGGPGTDWSVIGLTDVTASGSYATVYAALAGVNATVTYIAIVDDWNAGTQPSQVTTFTSIVYDGTALIA